MKLGNKKGFTGLEIIAITAIIGLVAIFVIKPVATGFKDLMGGIDRQHMVHKVDKTQTLWQKNEVTGKLEPIKNTFSEYINQASAEQPPETLWQKFWHVIWIAILTIGPLTAGLIWLFGWPKVKAWILAERAKAQSALAKHDELQTAAVDIVQAIDDGWDAYDAQVTVYNGLYTNEQDVTKKANYLAILSALQTAKKIMKDKIYAELDNASLAKLTALQTAQPGSTITSI